MSRYSHAQVLPVDYVDNSPSNPNTVVNIDNVEAVLVGQAAEE